MNFLQERSETIQKYGRTLLTDYHDNQPSFEAASQVIVQHIYDDFQNTVGQRMFELVRIFRMVTAETLPPEGQQDTPDSDQWLSLVATVGAEDPWNNRLESEGHRLLPSDAFQTPMLKATFDQLGFNSETSDFVQNAGLMSRYFHVEQAAGSPYIVAQDEFVKPYGIQSVLGIGSRFATGSLFVLLGFASTPIDATNAKKFSLLVPFIGTLLATYEESEHPIWSAA